MFCRILSIIITIVMFAIPAFAQNLPMNQFTLQEDTDLSDTHFFVGYKNLVPYRWTLGNLLLWMATQDWTPTGTWDFSGGTVTLPDSMTLTTPTFTLADDSTITFPAAAPATSTYNRIMGCNDDGTCDWISATDKCTMSFNSDTFECINQAALYTLIQSQLFDADGDGTFEGGEEISDEQLICGNVNSGLYTLKSCGAKVTDESTASHAIYKDSDSKLQNQVLTIDAHAASTTITLIPGICPIIHNASQAAADINNTLPAVGAGKCFVALATTAQAGNYWRLTSAAVNTVCLNRTCGKDYIQFATPAVGDTFTCMSDGTNWYCYDRDSDAEVGDL